MSQPIDMAAFEEQFNEGRLSNEMDNQTFDRMTFLRDRMKDLEESIEFQKEMMAFANKKNEEIREIQREIERLLAELRNKRKPYDDEVTNLKRNIRSDDEKFGEYKREWMRLQAELEARRRLIAERGLVDSNTADAPWRKDARQYQLEGAHRVVAGQRSILGDQPGLGKTLQSIIAIEMLRAKNQGKKVLIFTPKTVLNDYKRSFDRWTDQSKVAFVLDSKGKGNKTAVLSMVKHMDEIVIITNYEVWRRDKTILDAIIECQFDTLILDECHVLKDGKSKTFRDMKQIVYGSNKCSVCGQNPQNDNMCAICGHWPEQFGEFCSVENLIQMSGTTVLNSPEDLWTLLHLIDREAYPSKDRFLRDYCMQRFDSGTGATKWTFRSGGSEQLLKKLGVRYTARTAETAGVEMPPQEVKHHELELTEENYPRHFRFVKALRDQARLVFGDKQLTETETIAWYTRMRQAAVWPDVIKIRDCTHEPRCMDHETGKLDCPAPEVVFPPPGAPPVGESIIMDEAESIVFDAVNSSQRMVVFAHFNGVIDELKRRLEAGGVRVAVLNGKTRQHDREVMIDDFNANYTKHGEHLFDVILVHYKAGSVGLNFSGAHQALFMSREWNSGKEDQAMRRIRRMDSKYETQVHVLHAEGTATELIDALIKMKDENLEGFNSTVNLFEKMRDWLGE